MNAPVFFKSAGDERGTPQDFFDTLNAEFHFDIDLAASPDNKKCELYFGFGSELGTDALEQDWGGLVGFLNPPYSVAGAFVAKAREEADKGATVVLLLPVRSDTKWWHTFVWDSSAQRRTVTNSEGSPAVSRDPSIDQGNLSRYSQRPDGDWRPGVRGRLLPGRLNFELHVPIELRAWIQSELASGTDFKPLVEATGLPKMAIERIGQNMPDDCLLEGAPFPSCVVIFENSIPRIA